MATAADAAPPAAEKKKLRTTLNLTERIFLSLMPGSQISAWIILLHTASQSGLHDAVGMLPPLAVMHSLWAVKNVVYDQNTAEKGYLTFGVVTLGTAFIGVDAWPWGRCTSILGVFLVWVSYVFVLLNIVSWPPEKLAHVVRKTRAWANVFRGYVVSSCLFWFLMLVALLRRPLPLK